MTPEPDPPSRFGRGLRLERGDLVFEGGDLSVVEGPRNLLQGIQTMIETPAGSDLFDTRYGFDYAAVFAQPAGVRLTQALVRLHLVKALSLDDRVREVRDVFFDDDPRFFELVGGDPAAARRVRAAPPRQWRAVVVLVPVTGDELAVEVQGAGG